MKKNSLGSTLLSTVKPAQTPHEQDSSLPAHVPAVLPASAHPHGVLRLSSEMLTKFPCILYKQTKPIPSPFLKNGPLTLLKPKLVLTALGENTKQKPTPIRAFSS